MRQLIIKYNPSYKLADKDAVELNRDKLIELLSRYFSIGDSDTYEDLADWLIKELRKEGEDGRTQTQLDSDSG